VIAGGDAVCLLIGSLVSFVVSALKRIPIVKRYPKSAAFFINALVGAWTATHGSASGVDMAAIVQCVLAQFAASVTTHEAVTNQIQKIGRNDTDAPAD
jgi:NhaP-type Na+/H+ or K+/H+ antiporter